MATRVRESGVRGKEKKGTQVDHSMPQQHKRNTTTSKLVSSSVPNYLKPTTASSAVLNHAAAAGDKPHPSRRKSLDRPLSHLDTHRNLAGDKPSLARRKSFDRPIPHSSPSSPATSHANKPTFARTKSTLDKPKPSTTTISRSSETNDRRSKMMMRSISTVGKSSSSITHHHLKPLSDRPNMAKSHNNNTRKQPGTTLSSRTIKKKPAEIITSSHQEPSVTESADHQTEVFTNTDSNHTEISNNNNNNSKIVQEKENTVVADHEELEDLKSIEHCSLLVPEDPSFDLVDTIIEEGDEEPIVEISVPEKFQESSEIADTVLIAGDPHVEDNDEGENNNINNVKETTSIADPNSADEVSVEEKGDENNQNMLPTCNNSENCNEDRGEKQEKEEEREKEKDKKTEHPHHHQEQAEEIKEITDDQNNNINNNVVAAVPAATTHHSSSEAKPAGKKNESVVSNDVIEETASKLREQRKNKVKALAGAFETVISLQDK